MNYGWYLIGGAFGLALAGAPSESVMVLVGSAYICFEIGRSKPTQPQEPNHE